MEVQESPDAADDILEERRLRGQSQMTGRVRRLWGAGAVLCFFWSPMALIAR
jgi:hypothetical protein